ncbi:DUF2189 domain-containing protein [Sandarakinorhabdus rubra]|uniref:DUF2189 domain-containing protein n=1 Tax=Sandarakinorhabdus rubra TaxID=2672568 RepID=UPI0013DCD096|nr:DUF2189 domain-containing protein [Sandarakinorhabdus rubra]
MELIATPTDMAPVRALTTDDLRWALRRGWDDFRSRRGDLILLPIIYPMVVVLAAYFAFNARLFPLIFPLVAGFALLGPIAAAGFYELARRRETGESASWQHFLDPLKGRSRLPIALLTAMLATIFILWVMTAQALYTATLGQLGPATPAAFIADLFGTSQGLELIIVGNLVGAGFALVSLALAAFSFPMVVDKGVAPATAVFTSLAAFRRSPVTMIIWGLMVAGILVLGALPLFVGLMVALPVLGYATWHLYTRAVDR